MVNRMIDKQDPKVQFALSAVQASSHLVGEIQREMVTSAITKDDQSPVTVADFAVQAVIGYFLDRRFPEISLVAEEDAAVLRSGAEEGTLERVTQFVLRVIPDATPGDVLDWIDRGRGDVEDQYWTLDPIDGTKGFLRGDQFAVCLAYITGKDVQIGVLGCPNLTSRFEEELGGEGSLYLAVRGGGSWVSPIHRSLEDEGFYRLRVSNEKDSRQARLLRSFESGHTNVGQIVDFTEAMDVEVGPVRLDSQAKYALLAGGQAEIYLRLLDGNRQGYREKVWDQASGALLVEEAGGRVTDLGGKALDFSLDRRLIDNRGICATNGILHQETLDALQAIGA